MAAQTMNMSLSQAAGQRLSSKAAQGCRVGLTASRVSRRSHSSCIVRAEEKPQVTSTAAADEMRQGLS